MLRIGIGKGRGAAECARLLHGSEPPPAVTSGRLPCFALPGRTATCVLTRNTDLPWLLARGHIDAAFGGPLPFMDRGGALLQRVAGLGIAECRLSLIVRQGHRAPLHSIGTRYPGLSRRLVPAPDGAARMVRFAGSLEIAIELGICDGIVDVVETGWTIRTLGLEERAVLTPVAHAVFVRRGRSAVLRELRARFPQVGWAPPERVALAGVALSPAGGRTRSP